MSTWKTASLGEIFEIARGGSPRPIQDYLTDDPNGVNWISISDASASSKFITATKKRIRPEGVSRSRMVKSGDFLLTNSMSFGRPYIMGTNGCIHDGWLVLSSKHDDVDQDYFFQLLSSDFIYAKFSKLAAGATVKNLNIDLVSGVEVTFPPLEEQRRIAAILDQAETLRTQRRTALALLDSLTQSLFLDMFGDGLTNPHDWPTKSIDSVCELVVDCVNRTAPVVEAPTPYKMIRTTNVKGGSVDLSSVRYVSAETFKDWNRRATPRQGDVLLTREAPVGEAGILATNDNVFLGQRLMLYRPALNRLTSEYLLYSFMSPYLQLQFDRHGSGSTVKHLPLPACRAFELRIPPLPLQQTFATRIASIEALKATHRRALAALDALFASLQQRAFTGAL